ncbi:NmrA family transcriptional regulator [Streptosporangium sp. NPDC050855]|uniref:NmrA family transcriptional regulator n=1 Tax=Streptosporangium sp. NPDC050855 TaxID=3366194 RepID=UPI0037A754AF
MTERPVLVLGATGSTGRRVAALLRAAGHPVRAASREGGVRFDWTLPETWGPVLDGVSKMYLMAPSGVAVDPAFVAQAVERGVRRIVLLSAAAIEAMGDERLMAAERTVRACGTAWTILRPTWFAQNFDEGLFRQDVMAGELALPVGDLRQAFVDADDVAAVAVKALTVTGHAGRRYELTGPAALSFAEATAIVGRAAGHPVRFLGTREAYLDAQEAIGRSPAEVLGEIEAYAALRNLGDAEPGEVVRRVTGRAPKSFRAYAAEAAARGAWRDRATAGSRGA